MDNRNRFVINSGMQLLYTAFRIRMINIIKDKGQYQKFYQRNGNYKEKTNVYFIT